MSRAGDLLESLDLPGEPCGDCTFEKFKRVVRKGKIVRKQVCRPGYKAQGGKCVKISSQERLKRKKGSIRGARKARSKRSAANRSRKKSMNKRTWK